MSEMKKLPVLAETERAAIVRWLRETPWPSGKFETVMQIACCIERLDHYKPAPAYKSAMVKLARDTIQSIADRLGVPVSELVKDIKGEAK